MEVQQLIVQTMVKLGCTIFVCYAICADEGSNTVQSLFVM